MIIFGHTNRDYTSLDFGHCVERVTHLIAIYTPPMPTRRIYTSDLFATLKQLTLDCPPTGREAETWTKTSWSPRKWSKYRKAWDVPAYKWLQHPFFFGTGSLLTFVLHFLCLRYCCSLHNRHLTVPSGPPIKALENGFNPESERITEKTLEYFLFLRYPPQISNSCIFNI